MSFISFSKIKIRIQGLRRAQRSEQFTSLENNTRMSYDSSYVSIFYVSRKIISWVLGPLSIYLYHHYTSLIKMTISFPGGFDSSGLSSSLLRKTIDPCEVPPPP